MIQVSNMPDGSEAAPVVTRKSTTIKIPPINGIGPWELYHKHFEAAAAHNQWRDVQKAEALTGQIVGIHGNAIWTLYYKGSF